MEILCESVVDHDIFDDQVRISVNGDGATTDCEENNAKKEKDKKTKRSIEMECLIGIAIVMCCLIIIACICFIAEAKGL